MSYIVDVDRDIKERLCDFCHIVDGSVSDLLCDYDRYRSNFEKSFLRFEYYDRPSHLLVKAYRKVLSDYGYERRSLP